MFRMSSFAQEEQERPESRFGQEEETDEEDEREEEQVGRSEKKQSRTQSRALLTPSQPVRSGLMFLMEKRYECRAEEMFVSNVVNLPYTVPFVYKMYDGSQTKLNDFL